jgi:hypothetical protein
MIRLGRSRRVPERFSFVQRSEGMAEETLCTQRTGRPKYLMNRTTIILLAVCVALFLTCVGLSLALYMRPRFIAVSGPSPYIMFDTKTAQACWSGRRLREFKSATIFDLAVDDKHGILDVANQAELPFCKDLK